MHVCRQSEKPGHNRLLGNWRQQAPQGLLSWNTPSCGNSLKLEHNMSTHTKITLGNGKLLHIALGKTKCFKIKLIDCNFKTCWEL